MKTFAQVLNGKLHWKFDAPELPEFEPGLLVIDITGAAVMPQEGWVWDAPGGRFMPLPNLFVVQKTIELTAFRADRGKMLDCLSGIAGRFARAGDAASALACDVLAQGLLELPAFPSVAAAQDLPALKLAMKARYNVLLAVVPAPVMAAYKGVSA